MKLCPNCETTFESADWTCPACAHVPPRVNCLPLLAPALAEGGAGFPPEAFEKLAALEAQNFWFRARNQLIVWALKRHFPALQRYLEIGCGTGYVLAGVAQAYPAASLVGSEIFSAGLPYAAARVNAAELLQMDARHIPYVDEFEAIGAFDVLEHIEEDEAVLASMFQALKPGGGIAITVPQHPWLWSSADDHACHVRRYKVDELRQKVQRAGFKLAYETSFVSLLLPAMLASRLGKQRKKADEADLSELRLPSWLNAVFETIMNLERLLIRAGLRFGLGGSRLLVATKIPI
ncbi:MAG: SAM-dependent methyltransferase [Comamonadaceae bacterium CG12_big_fil_rev_8_21_14_0_65_59_15]|nr:MAG: SAM-dependent methyltransferase [Comamonadaceae bacterium CG12_big_fil_rev_8_21_14_0_65_59_15]